MKFLNVIALMFLFFSAQAAEVDDLLSLKKRTASGIVEEVFSGVPVVSFAPRPQTEEKFIPTPYKGGTADKPFLRATNVFGQQVSFPYVTHFPYFFVAIDLLADGSVSVTETFQLIISSEEANQTLERIFPKQYKGISGDTFSPIYDFVALKHNGQRLLVESKSEGDCLRVILPETYVGLHAYELTYHVKNAFKNTAFFLSLIGSEMPFPTERFSGWIRFPDNINPEEAQLVFGTNNLSVEKGVSFLIEREKLIFKVDRLLPEKTDVRLAVRFEKEPFALFSTGLSAENFLKMHTSLLIALLSVFLWMGYAWIQRRLAKRTMREKEFVQKAQKRFLYSVPLARFLIKKKTDERTIVALLLDLRNKGAVRFDEKMEKVLFVSKNKHLSLLDKKMIKFLFKHRKETFLRLCNWERFQKKILKKEIRKRLLFQFFSLTRQIWLTGLLLMIMTGIFLTLSGWNFASGIVFFTGYMFGAFLFTYRCGFWLYIKQMYQALYDRLFHFSQHTPVSLVTQMLPFAVALELTRTFSLLMSSGIHFSLTEQENLLFNNIKLKGTEKWIGHLKK